MIRIFIIYLVGLVTFLPPGQPVVDYAHKRLYRVLEKEWGMEEPEFTEVPVHGTHDAPLGKFFSVKDKKYASQHQYIYIGRVNSCRAGGCSISLDEDVHGDSEYFDYFILFDVKGTVQTVRVFNYQATHGQEVSARGWLRQFEGYAGDRGLVVGKDIDAIAGATISVYGITSDVEEKTKLLHSILE